LTPVLSWGYVQEDLRGYVKKNGNGGKIEFDLFATIHYL